MKTKPTPRRIDADPKPTKRPTNTDPTPTYGGMDLWHGSMNIGGHLKHLR